MIRFFENLLNTYPEAAPVQPPRTFMAFVWSCAKGARGLVLALTLTSALIAVFEALLFAFMGRIVDWVNAPATKRCAL